MRITGLAARCSTAVGCAATCSLLVYFLCLPPAVARGQGDPHFNPQKVLREPMRPIVRPKTVSAAQANTMLGEAELVLGVTVGDAARAYPINMLTGPSREIINDHLGDRDIAATW